MALGPAGLKPDVHAGLALSFALLITPTAKYDEGNTKFQRLVLSPPRAGERFYTTLCCKSPLLNLMWPQANFNLVTLPPDSDSLITEVDIWGAEGMGWGLHPPL